MNLWQLVRLGTDELVGLALAGRLRPRHVWTALQGAERYRAAVADGDVREPGAAARCAAACAGCPSRVEHTLSVTVNGLPVVRGSCGPFLEDRLGQTPPTCGCLCFTLVGDELTPAGLTVVETKGCPQGWW
jgi:hypothetical protein